MPEYYDVNQPFSLQNWNHLIQDVNDILQNPPDGCDPIDPLEEVSDPYIFTFKDIMEVRDKLKETCPTISFEEELSIWDSKIIDEIENAMDDVWCNCNEWGLVTKTMAVGTYTEEPLLASPGLGCCCGTIHEAGSNPICGTSPHIQYWYDAPYYPDVSSTSIETTTAWNANLNFQNAICRVIEAGGKILEYQGKVDSAVQNYHIYRDLYIQTGNEDYLPNLCYYGDLARTNQEDLDEWVDYFKEWYTIMNTRELLANSTASEEMTKLCNISTRYPIDVNLWPHYRSAFADTYAWKKWVHPTEDTYSDTTNLIPYGDVRLERSLSGGWVVGTNVGFSPNGTPYIKTGAGPYTFRLKLAHPFSKRYMRVFCDNWAGYTCSVNGVPVGACSWSEWYEAYLPGNAVWWLSHDDVPLGGTCNGINETTYFTWTAYCRATYYSERIGKNYTALQNTTWNRYNNWYEEHPKYDNEHEQYC